MGTKIVHSTMSTYSIKAPTMKLIIHPIFLNTHQHTVLHVRKTQSNYLNKRRGEIVEYGQSNKRHTASPSCKDG